MPLEKLAIIKPFIPDSSDAESARLTYVQQSIYDRLIELFPNGCKRVLLVTPPESPEQHFNIDLVLKKRYPCFPPYGPGVLARNLESRGYEGALLDLNYHVLKDAHEKPEQFQFRVWEEILGRMIETFNPDIIGLSVMFTVTLQSMSQVAGFLKQQFPSLPLIAGGICVSNDVERILRSTREIDIGSFYEGDRSFPDMLDVVNGKIPPSAIKQLAILKDDEFVSTRERALPTAEEIDVRPEYYDLPIADYTRYGSMGAYNFIRGERKGSTIISNRGCRARCSFCSIRNFNGLKVRGREVTSIVDEMEYLKERYGITHFMWLDDDLLNTGQRAIRLFNEIIRRDLKITWDASNGLIAAAITPEVMHAASESGCIGFNLGLESGNDDILRAIHKPGTTKMYRRAKEILAHYPHVFVKGFMIIGFPNETIDQMRDSVNLACDLQFGWYPLQLLTPLPGTEITLSMVEQGLVQPPTEASFKGSAAGSKSGSGGALRRRELDEKHQAREFFNLLEVAPADYVPTAEELEDLWFVADYKMNYEKILHIHEATKLRNIQAMLRQITDEYTNENALGHLYLAVIASKLDDSKESDRRLRLAESYQRESAYWSIRFERLGMTSVVDRVRAANASGVPF